MSVGTNTRYVYIFTSYKRRKKTHNESAIDRRAYAQARYYNKLHNNTLIHVTEHIRRIRPGKFRTNSDSSKRLLKENFNSRAYSGTSPPGPRTNRCEKSSSTHLTPQSAPHRQYQLSRAQHFFRVIELSKFRLDPRVFSFPSLPAL